MDYQSVFTGKKITVMGLGLLGRSVGDARFLAECGAEVLVTDLKTAEQLQTSVDQLRDLPNVQFVLGEHRLEDFRDCDVVLKNPDVKPGNIYLEEARRHGVPIEMSASWFLKVAGITAIGVTGTRGKSTATHLINHVLTQAGYHTLLGGNVRGVSTLALLPEVTPDSVAILELDSWQLQGFGADNLSPQYAVFTTFMPDHMNYYCQDQTQPGLLQQAMRDYFNDKAQIFLHQKPGDVLVMGQGVVDEYGDWIARADKERAQVVSAADVPMDWHVPLPGEHNRLNTACAVACLRAFGLSDEVIQAGVESFSGVEGRLQFMKEIQGVRWYNDNNATTPDATIAALRALDDGNRNVILLCGGVSKGLDMQPLVTEIKERCKAVILLDETGTRLLAEQLAVGDEAIGVVKESLAAMVAEAAALAQPGDVVLFSPAFASFGKHFQNEYDRNDQFVALVTAIA